ncbi:MAG: hypothetical protein RLZZ505_1930 [Verrucomicrobiota bacterium]|jgi:hypothetical protein
MTSLAWNALGTRYSPSPISRRLMGIASMAA